LCLLPALQHFVLKSTIPFEKCSQTGLVFTVTMKTFTGGTMFAFINN
jgi:hypothetical protein